MGFLFFFEKRYFYKVLIYNKLYFKDIFLKKKYGKSCIFLLKNLEIIRQ